MGVNKSRAVIAMIFQFIADQFDGIYYVDSTPMNRVVT